MKECEPLPPWPPLPTPPPRLQRHKLNLKAKVQSSISHLSFKRLVPASRRFQVGFDRGNLQRPTRLALVVPAPMPPDAPTPPPHARVMTPPQTYVNRPLVT